MALVDSTKTRYQVVGPSGYQVVDPNKSPLSLEVRQSILWVSTVTRGQVTDGATMVLYPTSSDSGLHRGALSDL